MKKEELKKEISLELKTKFMALYWGVKCLRNELLNDQIPPSKVDNGNCKGLPQQYLELKPLSSITDEDAKAICGDKEYFENTDISNNLNHRVADYLRSKGYALNWNGITVEQQIEFGWIKLIEK